MFRSLFKIRRLPNLIRKTFLLTKFYAFILLVGGIPIGVLLTTARIYLLSLPTILPALKPHVPIIPTIWALLALPVLPIYLLCSSRWFNILQHYCNSAAKTLLRIIPPHELDELLQDTKPRKPSRMKPPKSTTAASPRAALTIPLYWLYGVILTAGSLLIAGPGDGSYTFLGWVSAPISTFTILFFQEQPTSIILATILTPFMWAAAGLISQNKNLKKRRTYLLSFLLLHCIGGVLTLMTEPYSNWAKLSSQWVAGNCGYYIAIFVIFYLGGQVALWRRIANTDNSGIEPGGSNPIIIS